MTFAKSPVLVLVLTLLSIALAGFMTNAHAYTYVDWEGTAIPAARTGHVAVYDPIGDRIIMYGGRDNTRLFFTLWQLTMNPPQWTELVQTGPRPPLPYLGSAAYDPIRGRLVYTGGLGGLGFAVNTLDIATGTWSNPALNVYYEQALFSRYGHSTIFDPVRDRVVVFGGHGDPLANEIVYSDAFEVTFATNPPEVRQVGTAGTQPGARFGHAAVYDPQYDRMIVTYGFPATGAAPLADVFMLKFSNTPSTWMKAWVMTSSRRAWHSATFDPEYNRTVLYGGTDDDAFPPNSSDLISTKVFMLYNNADESVLGYSKAWPSGTIRARKAHTATVARSPSWPDDKMIVIGGSDVFASGFLDASAPNQTVLSTNYGLPLSFYVPGATWEPFPSSLEPPAPELPPNQLPASMRELNATRGLDLLQNTPNPFRYETRVAFDLPREDHGVRLEVFDLTGRRISVLAEGQFPAGRHVVGWNARDDWGNRVAAGVYVYRLRTTQGVISRRIVVQ